MSQEGAEANAESAGFDTIEEWATAAVRGSNNWLVTLRNATDEGIDPWSDQFTEKAAKRGDDESANGIMSYAEGLTALGIVKNYVNVSDDPDWNTLRTSIYENDLRFILKKINHEDGPKFSPAPYLDESTTSSFTAAATFSTSAILESLNAETEAVEKIDDEKLKNGIETSLDWLLSNRVDELENTDGGAGWAWVGSENRGQYKKALPHNYFTYSATLVLCDILDSRENDIVADILSNHKEELGDAIEETYRFLLEEHWDGNKWTTPGRTSTSEGNLLMTCYAFIGLSYIEYTVDDVDFVEVELSQTQREKMAQGMEWILGQVEDDEYIWAKTTEYSCDDEDFDDGSVPYVLIDSLLELANYREDLIDYIEGWDQDSVEELARNELAPVVLENCWAGDKYFETKGFRHIGDVDTLVDREDGDPKSNMTAMYSTGTAIETFLLNFLEEGDDIEKRERKVDETTTTDDGTTGGSGEPQEISKKTINNTIVLDGEDSGSSVNIDDSDALFAQLGELQTEMGKVSDELADGIGGDGSDVGIDELDRRSLQYFEDHDELTKRLKKEYDDEWMDTVCDTVSSIGQALGNGWEDQFRRKNEERFLAFLAKLYFCPDQETYKETVKYPDADAQYLLPPQWHIRDEVKNEWDEDDFADADARKSKVEDYVSRLNDEPWKGEEVLAVVSDFRDRYND